MRVSRSDTFAQEYRKLPAEIRKKIDRQLIHLSLDMRHPALNARKMVNQAEIWEARIDLHYRLTFTFNGDVIWLRRVGTHEVYHQP
jgi:mRNA-degrading endonuclease RelE of RelBE toxin-antitoxin system